MDTPKTKSIRSIEEKMEGLHPGSFRYKVLESAKNFKSSWLGLGRLLFTAYKDKLFKDWGYLTFEAYCSKEIGVRQATAVKLLKSYAFLESDEPEYLKAAKIEERRPSEIPSFEAVNSLRLAKQGGALSPADYRNIREDVLERVKESVEIKKKIRYILKKTETPSSEDLVSEKEAFLKKMVRTLEEAYEAMLRHGLPEPTLKQVDQLARALKRALEEEISESDE